MVTAKHTGISSGRRNFYFTNSPFPSLTVGHFVVLVIVIMVEEGFNWSNKVSFGKNFFLIPTFVYQTTVRH